jgi:protease II
MDGKTLGAIEEFLPSTEGYVIEEIDVFDDYIVVYGKKLGLPSIMVHNKQTGESKFVDAEEIC